MHLLLLIVVVEGTTEDADSHLQRANIIYVLAGLLRSVVIV